MTGSTYGASALPSYVISGSYFLPNSTLATGTFGAMTGSTYGNVTYPVNLVIFQQPGGIFTPVTYVMTGYYIAGAARETWIGNAVTTPNPTGHPLVDITVMGSYPPQNSAT